MDEESGEAESIEFTYLSYLESTCVGTDGIHWLLSAHHLVVNASDLAYEMNTSFNYWDSSLWIRYAITELTMYYSAASKGLSMIDRLEYYRPAVPILHRPAIPYRWGLT